MILSRRTIFAIGALGLPLVQGNLIISGYIEGSSNNKYLRFSALTEIPVNGLADYQVEIYFNGNASPGTTIQLNANTEALQECDSLILADNNANLGASNQDSTSSFFNGDDLIVLKNLSTGQVVDSIGQVGVDPGSEYSSGGVGTQNESLCRKATVVAGDTDTADIFDPSVEWISYPVDTFFTSFDPAACLCTESSTPPPPSAPQDVFIHEIQGSGFSSPLDEALVRVEAIVVGDFQNDDADEGRNLNGFFLQEEDTDMDPDPATSEGIFVFDGSIGVDVALGDRVVVVGTVDERFGQTQISADSVEIMANDVPLPTPAYVSLPTNLEAVEGMLVEFTQDLTIIEQFNLDRFGEVRLFAGDRPYQFTQLNAPDQAGFETHLEYLVSLSVVYEDGRSGSTNNVDPFDGFSPYFTATAPRMGDIFGGLSGVMTYGFSEYRVRSVLDGSNVVTSANPRSAAPTLLGNFHIASLNVQNFFLTLNQRGADTATEYNRQLEKLTTAIVDLDADILGLVELENSFPTVLEALVASVNTRIGKNDYSFVDPGRATVDTSDVISVGFIYKSKSASILGEPAILDDSVLPSLGLSGPVFDGVNTNRASLAVTFESNAGKQCVTIANNHFKSKGNFGGGATGLNDDQEDGAGFYNERRAEGAEAVIEWLKTYPTGVECDHEAIMGDINAYAQESPVQAFLNAGYFNVEPDDAYSYVFDGQIGTLDYIFLNCPMNFRLNEAAVWHINEDEADAIDYNLDFGRPDTFFDGQVPYRCSDHSPVVAGLTMARGNGCTVQKTCRPSNNTRSLIEDTISEKRPGNLRSRLLNGWFECGPTHCVKERSTCEVDEATNEHYCRCLDGYDGFQCRPTDECETAFPCPGGSKCVDMDPPMRFKCVCESGYTPILPDTEAFDEPNVPIEYRPTQCVDRLECEEAESPCHPDATCENTIGRFECKCKDGLVGNGVSTCELPEVVDIAGATTDPAPSGFCVTDEDCTGANMQCVESECACFPGYAQVGPNCQNEVHCDPGGFNNDCHRRATCTEESGFPGFSCQCVKGWEDAFKGANGKACKVAPPPETEAPPEPITDAAVTVASGVGPHPNRPTVFPSCSAIAEPCVKNGQCCSGTCE